MLKKGYCLNCHNKKEADNVFDVNEDASVVYCPRCMKAYKPKVVIDAYKNLLAEKMDKTGFVLSTCHDNKKAYTLYGEILEIEPTFVKARYGRLISLLAYSNLDTCYFEEAAMLYSNEAKLYYRKDDVESYYSFNRKIDHLLEYYWKSLQKRLQIKGYFYDFDCLSLYVGQIEKIKRFYEKVLEECDYLCSKAKGSIYSPLKNHIEENISFINAELEKSYIVADGHTHNPIGRNKDNEIIYGASEQLTETGVKPQKIKHLVASKGSKKINRYIFKTKMPEMFTRFNSGQISIVFLIIAVVLSTISLLFLKEPINIIGFSISVFLILTSIAHAIMHLLNRKKEKTIF